MKQEEWDRRFSRDNVKWATEFFEFENIAYDVSGNIALSVGSHPAILNGFIDLFRKEVSKYHSLEKPSLKIRLTEKKKEVNGYKREQIGGGQRSQMER